MPTAATIQLLTLRQHKLRSRDTINMLYRLLDRVKKTVKGSLWTSVLAPTTAMISDNTYLQHVTKIQRKSVVAIRS
jgi:hypothetical protein